MYFSKNSLNFFLSGGADWSIVMAKIPKQLLRGKKKLASIGKRKGERMDVTWKGGEGGKWGGGGGGGQSLC